jgi:hypothetical protein
MHFQKISTILGIFLLLLGSYSCGSLQVISPTNLPTVRIDTPTPTRTTNSESIKTLITTPSMTVTPRAVLPTDTPIATLSKDLAYARFENLLQTNGDCQLPCWWGIIPGNTSFIDAQNILKSIGSITTSSGFGNYQNMGSGS